MKKKITIVIQGDPGIGKSQFAEALIHTIRNNGCIVDSEEAEGRWPLEEHMFMTDVVYRVVTTQRELPDLIS